MKNIVGTPARGASFFSRDREVKKIQLRIEAGNNLQLAAPRRVGKTSILFYLLDNNVDGHIYVYADTERIDTEQQFYKKLLKEILKVDAIAQSGRLKGLLEKGERFFRKIKSVKVMGAGIDFHESDTLPDYYEELTNFLSGFELEEGRKLVLLIDEFPQTILNIADLPKGGTASAIRFLQSNRELRLNPDINQKVRFIYTGSIGLNHTVAAINATAFVNDLNSIEVEPLSLVEATALVQSLLADNQVMMDEATIAYLLQKIGWLIPFHIQLSIQEIHFLCYQNKTAGCEVIDQAFDNMMAIRNNNHFEHYHSRIKSQFKDGALQFADALLQRMAMEGTLTKISCYDMAVMYSQEANYRNVLEVLVYDGYINNTEDVNVYCFNSPILRMWWQKYICK